MTRFRGSVVLGLPLYAALTVAVALTAPRPEQPGPGDKPYASTAQERDKAFRWFSTLGFPDLKGRKLVRVATGQWSRVNDAPPRNSCAHGFLLAEKGDTFTVFTLGLASRTFKKTPAGTPEHERVGFDEAARARLAADRLRALREREDNRREYWHHFGAPLSERAAVFVLAWAC
ncbi:MAG: hypothetical protein L0Z62_22520 [Gemmataceae bacterium]|nr:hypothetical protein [Gemmataceae bacterium]